MGLVAVSATTVSSQLTLVSRSLTHHLVIKTFKHKGLRELFDTGASRKVAPDLQRRVLRKLDALAAATVPADLNLPGFDFHSLNGFDPVRYTIHVNGPWCITFAFENGDANDVDLEQYH